MRQEAADNTKLLHDMIVNMENLGEAVKNMQNELTNWGAAEGTEMEVETEEDRLHQQMNYCKKCPPPSHIIHIL